MLRLLIKMPGGGETSIHAEGPDIFVGRVPSINDICLNDLSVSRQHAHIKRREEGYTIYDLKSLNGIVLNGARVSRATLKEGDVIQLGDVSMAVRLRSDTKEEELLAIERSERTQASAQEKDLYEKTRRATLREIMSKKPSKKKKPQTR